MPDETYNPLAKYYNVIYFWKNYEKESQKIKSLIKKYKKSDGNDLLEIACGTGQHTQYLKETFSIVATDISKNMLAIAKRNITNVKFKQMDMIHLDLNKTFDAIICLFSSIGYVKNYKNLTKTISNFARHLKKGGIIIEPWFTEQGYLERSLREPFIMANNSSDTKIARLTINKKRGILSIMDEHLLIVDKNRSPHYLFQRHEIAMFEVDKVLHIMKEYGLKAKFLKKDLSNGKRGLYIAVKA